MREAAAHSGGSQLRPQPGCRPERLPRTGQRRRGQPESGGAAGLPRGRAVRGGDNLEMLFMGVTGAVVSLMTDCHAGLNDHSPAHGSYFSQPCGMSGLGLYQCKQYIWFFTRSVLHIFMQHTACESVGFSARFQAFEVFGQFLRA